MAFNVPSLDFFKVVYSWAFFFICQICHILLTSSHDMSHDTIFVLRWKFCCLPFCNYTFYVLLHVYNFQLFLNFILYSIYCHLLSFYKWPILFFKECLVYLCRQAGINTLVSTYGVLLCFLPFTILVFFIGVLIIKIHAAVIWCVRVMQTLRRKCADCFWKKIILTYYYTLRKQRKKWRRKHRSTK